MTSPFPAVRHVEAGHTLDGVSLLDQPGSQRIAEIWNWRTLEAKSRDLLVAETPLFPQMLSMGRGKLEHIQQRGVGLMDHWQGRPLRQHDLALHLLLAPRLILRGKAAGQQRIANLTVSRRVTDILHFGVQGQHPAAVAAAVATPYVLGQVDTQFPPLTAAQGAVSIDIAGTPPPDMQAEEFDYIYDGKGKIRPSWMPSGKNSFPSLPNHCLGSWKRYPAFFIANSSSSSEAAAFNTFPASFAE